MSPSLTLAGITKRFGGVVALGRVDFAVQGGEVHALVGENGAGKTTLLRIAYGMLAPDSGSVVVRGEGDAVPAAGRFASPAEARAAGIGMVHQHFTSIPAFTVAENIALAAGWPETGRRAEGRARKVIEELGFPLDPRARTGELSVQLRQRLEVVKALAANARILLLDEPSAVLAPREVQELLRAVRGFAERGGAVALITHKLDEVFAIAGTATVLRRGTVVHAGPLSGESPRSLARAMIGGDLPRHPRVAPSPGADVVRAEDLVLAARGRRAIDGASFRVRAGEIVGVAAIEGNGQHELLRAVAGLGEARCVAGTLTVRGTVALVPEDRTTEGIIPEFTLAENVLLGTHAGVGGWVDRTRLATRTAGLLDEFDVRAEGPSAVASELSGGNQQKLILARALAERPALLVAEDPTRGLDLQAADAIHERLRAAARGGVAVLLHSSDLDEVLALSDRLLVVANGTVRELPPDSSREVVGDAMLGLGVAG